MPTADSLRVLRPASAAEAGELVRAAAAAREGVYPCGRRTTLQLPPARKPGVLLDLAGLAGVVDYPSRDLTVTVLAGTAVADLDRVLAAENQRLPVDLGSGTLGGAVAADRSGPRRLGFGTLRDYLIGVRFLTPAGEEAAAGGRVVKNVAGYDFMKLHTGAGGSLGVLTELTFKVVPRPEAAAVVRFGLNPAAVGPTLDRLNLSATRPVAVEVYNRPAADSRWLPADDPWLIAVGFEEKATTVAWQVATLAAELATAPVRGLTVLTGDAAGPAWDLLTLPASGDGLVLAGQVRPGGVAAVLLATDGDGVGVAARGLSGGFTVTAPAGSAEAAAALLAKLRAAAGYGRVWVRRRPADWPDWRPPAGPPRGDAALMRAVKQALDPADVFHPGWLDAAV